MKIGNTDVGLGLFLGPMAGVSDYAFRKLCKDSQCDVVCTEMISAKGILYNNKNTDALLQTDIYEKPIAVQMFGSEPDIVAEMALRIEDKFDFIDFNMGCPVPKVVNNGEGSALMKNPKLAGDIIKAMVRTVHKPVTVKIRKGFSESKVNAVEVAKILEQSGASAIAVHARTREQYYSGQADWDIIRQVKSAVQIPIIGNGDIVDGPSAKRMIDETGCDGIMIARAAEGNPWIFAEVKHYLETGIELDKPDLSVVKATILRHVNMQIETKGLYIGIREMRKHIAWYTHGLKNSAMIRREVNTIENVEELVQLIDKVIYTQGVS